MKLIGGEIHRPGEGLHTYLTDSGRSSLRLILGSGLKGKKFLLPDFLCKIIPTVFDEMGVEYSYYKVLENLSIDLESTRGKDFDVLYLINYFGNTHDVFDGRFPETTMFLEDCVFSPVVDAPPGIPHWAGFNSFRKMSFLADGSLVKSSIRLNEEMIRKDDAPFSHMKYEAKRMKHEYLHSGSFSEEEYLKLFNDAERCVDAQKTVFSMSGRSLANVLEFYRNMEGEYTARTRNYQALDRFLGHLKIKIRTNYYSLYPLWVDHRDELRTYLFSHRVFLPVHWPNSGFQNSLYDHIISVPVDSRYDESDMERVADLIVRFYSERSFEAPEVS